MNAAFDPPAAGGVALHGLTGEAWPRWVAPMLGVIGALVAVAAALLWIEQQSTWSTARVEGTAVGAHSEGGAAERSLVRSDQVTAILSAGMLGGVASVIDTATRAAATCPGTVRITFPFNSAVPIEPPGSALAALIAALARHPGARIAIQGHADSMDADQYNLLLSYRRARSAAALLVANNVPMQRIVLSASGSHGAAAEPETEAPEQLRRADLELVGVAGCDRRS